MTMEFENDDFFIIIIMVIMTGGEPDKAGGADGALKGDQHVRSHQLRFCNRFV